MVPSTTTVAACDAAVRLRPAGWRARVGARRALSLLAAAITVAGTVGCSGGSSQGSSGAGTAGTSGASRSASATPSGGAPAAPGTATTPAKPLDLHPSVGTAPPPGTVRGFAYATPSDAALRAAATAGNQYGQLSSGRVVRGITRNGRRIGDVAVFGLQPKFASSALLQEQLVHSVLTGMSGPGAKTSAATVGKVRTQVATTAKTYALGWYESGAIVVVVGQVANRSGVRDFVTAFPRLR